MKSLYAILALIHRDIARFVRRRGVIFDVLFIPVITIGVLGGSLRYMTRGSGFDYMVFIFTGVLAATMFNSSAQGVMGLLDDLKGGIGQELFIAPLSRYTLVFGRLAGQAIIAVLPGLVLIIYGLLLGVRPGPVATAAMAGAAVVACLFGSAFGVVILPLMRRLTLDRFSGYLFFPQMFIAGVYLPVQGLPPAFDLLSRLMPMRYVVDLMRSGFYYGRSDYGAVVQQGPLLDAVVIAALFCVFLVLGTNLYVKDLQAA